MLDKKYLFYNDFLKNRIIKDKKILISKTFNSILIGPIIDRQFDEESFYKRIISNSIYSTKIYKKINRKKDFDLIIKHEKNLSRNEVIEILKNGTIIKHNIIKVPGGLNEK